MQVLGLTERVENYYNVDTQEYWHKEFKQRKRKSNINFWMNNEIKYANLIDYFKNRWQ